jgi:hypothetical protein
MDVAQAWQLSPLVFYDDYDALGYLLDIRHMWLEELDERDTLILGTVLQYSSLAETMRQLKLFPRSSDIITEADVCDLLERLKNQMLLKPKAVDSLDMGRDVQPSSCHKYGKKQSIAISQLPVTLGQRLTGAVHMISILAELCKGDEGLYKAHQYLWNLKEHCPIEDPPDILAFALIRQEYWFYRLITGFVERWIAHLLGQIPGDEGLCLIRSFSLCAYFLSLGVETRVVMARPKYGSRGGFKLHVWAARKKKPLNEQPNIREAYRIFCEFPD